MCEGEAGVTYSSRSAGHLSLRELLRQRFASIVGTRRTARVHGPERQCVAGPWSALWRSSVICLRAFLGRFRLAGYERLAGTRKEETHVHHGGQ